MRSYLSKLIRNPLATIMQTGVLLIMASGFAPIASAHTATTPTVSSSRLAAPTASSWSPQHPGYRVIIGPDKPEGLYRLDYNYLANAGLPVDTIDPRTFRMYWMGEEIAIRVEGEADGSFDAGDSILFYGRNVDSLFYDGQLPTNKYTGENVFWLSYGGAVGKRMAEVDGTPASAQAVAFPHKEHLEENHYYLSTRPFIEGEDHWYWLKMEAYGPNSTSRDFTFTANNIATGAYTGELTVKLLSNIEGDGGTKIHELTLYVNGNEVYHNKGDWQGDTLFVATAQVDQAYFQNGSNTITIKITNDNTTGFIDQVYPNWIDVEYFDTFVAENDSLIAVNESGGQQQYQVSQFSSNDISIYDVSDIKNVKRIINGVVSGAGPYTIAYDSNATKLLTVASPAWQTPTRIESVNYPTSNYTPADLLDASIQADYIIITHREFWTPILDLADHRAHDYAVVMVDAQQVYDQFNGGMMSAEAIRDFLSYTYDNWAKRPTFVLLVGDATYDMRNYLGNSFPTYIPVYLKLVGSTTGETDSDNRFVTLVNDSTYGDKLPDMHIGRFPVNTTDEAQAMVDKTIAYENATCDPMPLDVLFVADDEDGNLYWDLSDGIADGYADPPDNTIKYLPDPYVPVKKYLGKDCNYAADGNAISGDECRQQIIDKLNTTGALLVSYVGHSTKDYWAVEQVWNESAVDQLTNSNACELPVMINLGCDEGYFHNPTDSAVSEYDVRKASVGAVASISPTYYGYPYGHDAFEKGFFLAVFHDGIQELGIALTKAKQHAMDEGYNTEPDGYLLMGDPAMKIKTTQSTLGEVDSSIALVLGSVQLSWNTVEGASQIDIYRSTDAPYFTPSGTPYASDVSAPWQDPDPNAIGDPAHNYFYVVRASDASGNTSDGPHHGEFDFALVPGN
jgi:hypothetical protein